MLKDFEVVFNKVDNLNFILEERDKNYKNKIYHFKKQINDANIVILSYLWSKNLNKSNIEFLKKFSKNLKKNNKKLVVISSPEFEIRGRFTFLDLFILKNKKIPKGIDKIELEKKYFRSYESNKNLINTNLDLISISENSAFIFLDLTQFLCDKLERTCIFLTDNGEKIMFDDDHFTLSGSKFLGEKILSHSLFN